MYNKFNDMDTKESLSQASLSLGKAWFHNTHLEFLTILSLFVPPKGTQTLDSFPSP